MGGSNELRRFEVRPQTVHQPSFLRYSIGWEGLILVDGDQPAFGEGDSGQQAADDISADREAPAPELAHDIFSRMQDTAQCRILEEADRALQGVDRPERAIQQARVARLLFEQHQVIADLLDQFTAFDQKLFKKLVHHAVDLGFW